MDGLNVPSREQMYGHWYLVATAEAFLDKSPRLNAGELIAGPAEHGRVHFLGEFTTPHRRYRFQAETDEPETDGRFNWTAMRGMSIFTRSWTLAVSRDDSVLAAFHTGSLVIQPGFAIFCRSDVSRADAHATVAASGRELGMLPRQQESLSFRERPTGMDESGASELSGLVRTASRLPRFAVRRLARP